MSILNDGFPTTLTFSAGVSGVTLTSIMKEKEVTPPGISAEGEVDTTTMRNTTYRTRVPKQLKTGTPASAVVAYDPALYDEILDLIGVNQAITITFPDTSTIVVWGWLDAFTPTGNVEGTQPTADLTIISSNVDGSGDEIAIAYSA